MKQFKGPAMQRGFWGAIASAVIGGYFSKKAAGQQAAGEESAANLVLESARPYSEAGQQALPQLVDLALQAPDFSLSADAAKKDILNFNAAGGKLLSGGTLDSLQRNRMEFENLQKQTHFSNLFNLATMGGNAAVGAGNSAAGFLADAAGSRAAGTRAVGSAVGEGFTGFMDWYKNRRPGG